MNEKIGTVQADTAALRATTSTIQTAGVKAESRLSSVVTRSADVQRRSAALEEQVNTITNTIPTLLATLIDETRTSAGYLQTLAGNSREPFTEDQISPLVTSWTEIVPRQVTTVGGINITVAGRGFNPDIPGLYTCVFTLDRDNSRSFRFGGFAVSATRIECPVPSWTSLGLTVDQLQVPTLFTLLEGDLKVLYGDGATNGPIVSWLAVGPTIAAIGNQQLFLNAVRLNNTLTIPLVLDDADSGPQQLSVAISSSNQSLISSGNITVVVSFVCASVPPLLFAH